ncbi:sushi, von Willebrand factor type A, EGF and pentraxin domain-containing protein 1 isoform X2 [Patella vulgata]|uniref:sushi, von Willebrand factor type A, EGF and pentraxin domain-containing protein 1 isoform X2 n=1 Tax=Patella vulgata TaxID=6465 RepID=UPI00217F6168|nr:sushi, von Willebrand factor type A, EGF and pentraxin domain-containing protein 1 isoform X2 [Patella vulgata]
MASAVLYIILLTRVIGLSFAATSNAGSAPCPLQTLEVKEIYLVDCPPELVNTPNSYVSHGVTCMVTCKSYYSGKTWRQCFEGQWQGPPIECPVYEQDETEKMSRRKRSCTFDKCLPPETNSGSEPHLKCPGDITEFGDPYQTHAKVFWTEPTATDDRDGIITPKRHGLAPGLIFSEGKNTVGYSARDRAGNMATCKFMINIIVIRCPSPESITDGWQICHPSQDFVLAANCQADCYGGHDLNGASHYKCLQSKQWSEPTPKCEKKNCESLRGCLNKHCDVLCTDGSQYRSVCTYTCHEGYGVASGMSRVQVCQEDGTWRGGRPQCIDNKPPKFSYCPSTIVEIADKGKNSTTVSWPIPKVDDNSTEHISPVLIKGKQPGSTFTIGVHTIEYSAKDAANNKAKTCKFKVVVKEIVCHTLYPRVYQTVSCPDGYRYGSECIFGCDDGTVFSKKDNSTTCRKIRKGNRPEYGVWSFGKSQPICEITANCPYLKPPDNGAIACNIWYGGKFCQLQCQKGYDVTPEYTQFKQLLMCGKSGCWNNDVNFPQTLPKECKHCRRSSLILKGRFYFDGDCNSDTVKSNIQNNFIHTFMEQMMACQYPSKCVEANVKVECGSKRVKRKSETNEVHSNLTYVVSETNDTYTNNTYYVSEPNEMYTNDTNVTHLLHLDIIILALENDTMDDINTRTTDVVKRMVDLKETSFTVGDEEITIKEIDTPTLSVDCSDGYVAADTYCTPCPEGSYHDKIQDGCLKCPIGQYQGEEGQIFCIQCPDGSTTRIEGAVDGNQCENGCPVGTSSANGIEPCTPCGRGQYQSDIGQRSCIQCPGSQTTETEGSSNMSECLDFDIQFLGTGNDSIAVQYLESSVEVEDISLSFWFSCSICTNLFQMKDETMTWLEMNITNTSLIVTFDQLDYNLKLPSLTNKWHHVNLILSDNSLKVWNDGTLKINEDIIGITHNISSIELGGTEFQGSISQFQVWNNSRDIADQPSKCFGNLSGNLITWRDFILAGFDGSFVDLPSTCDDTDDCQSHPCQNNATCEDGLNEVTCHCVVGFTDEFCDANINDCVDNVCLNNGTCIDDVDDYHCGCPTGFKGKYCEIVVVDGGWTDYSTWSVCSATCGNGTRYRKRVCNDPSPDNGGLECEGNSTEVEECIQQECIFCEDIVAPENGYIDCDNSTDHIICTTGCNQDYMNDIPPLKQYICGPSTFYEWNYHSVYNPYKRLPYCSKFEPAVTLSVIFGGTYSNLSCDQDDFTEKFQEQSKQQITTLLFKLDCVKSQMCTVDTVKVSSCANIGDRQKRSLEENTAEIEVVISSLSADHSDKIKQLQEAISSLNSAALKGEFTVDVLQNIYELNNNSTESQGKAGCPVGSWPYDVYCVPCGLGSYMKEDYCELCEIGQYTDSVGQTGCKTCPVGKTTRGLGSRNESECDVVPVTSIMSVSVLVVLVVLVLVIFLFNHKSSSYGLHGSSDEQIPKTTCDENMSSAPYLIKYQTSSDF